MTSQFAALLASLVAAEAEKSAGATPYFVGGGILLLLFVAVLAMLVFGKGREHS